MTVRKNPFLTPLEAVRKGFFFDYSVSYLDRTQRVSSV